MAFPIQMYLRVSHTGFMPDGSPNPESVLIPDMDLGYEYQHRKSPVYVPVGGFINLPFVSKVIYSASQGALGRFVTAGVLNVSYFFACRNTSNFGGAGGVGIPLAGGGNNIVRNGDVLTVVIDAGTNTSGFILGELVTITGLVGAYLGVDGDFTITGFTKGADLAGINPLCCLVTFASPGANIAAGVQAPLLTLPDGMITHIFSSSGNAGGLGANVNTYLTGDLIVTGNIDPEKIIFSPVDLTGAEPNTMGVDLNSGKLVFTNETGATTEISTTIAKSGSTPLVGDVTLSAGANVALTQAGQDIQISVSVVDPPSGTLSTTGAPVNVGLSAPPALGYTLQADTATEATWKAPPAAVGSLKKSGEATLTGAVELGQGANVTLTQAGQVITIAAAAAPAAVNSLAKLAGAALTGAVTLSEGSNVVLTPAGQDIAIAIKVPRIISMLSSDKTIPSDGATYEYGQVYFDPAMISVGQSVRFCAEARVGDILKTGTIALYNLTDGELVTSGLLSFNDGDLLTHHKVTLALTVGHAVGDFRDTAKIYTAHLTCTGANGASEVLVPSNIYLEIY